MKLIKAILRLFKSKKPILGGGNFSYRDTRYISKKGADIIPGAVPIPVGDELQSTLFRNNTYTLVAMCIYEKILWFIPWHYYEYIVWLKNENFNYDNTTAEDVIALMDQCCNWNKRDVMKPDDRFKSGSFSFKDMNGNITHSYDMDDYTFMKMNNIDKISFEEVSKN